jgi:hypothetical protein
LTRMFMSPAVDREVLASGLHGFLKDRLKFTEVLPQAENPFDKGNLLYVHHERKDKGWDGITASEDSEYFGLSHSTYKLVLKVPEYRGPQLDRYESTVQNEAIKAQLLKISSLLGGKNEITNISNDFNYGTSDVAVIYSSESKYVSGDRKAALVQMEAIEPKLDDIQQEINALVRLVKGQDLCEAVIRSREAASAAMIDPHAQHKHRRKQDQRDQHPQPVALA